MMALYELLRPHRMTAIVDIGANPIDGNPPYTRMLNEGVCNVTGFEPSQLGLEKLEKKKGPNEVYMDWAIGDGLARPFYHRQAPGMSGFLEEMSDKSLEVFPAFRAWSVITGSENIKTKRLDDISLSHCDMIKMDVQGGELDIIKGAPRTFAQAVMVMTEVSFVNLYAYQPTFADVDIALRALGFIPHCFAEAKMWPIGDEQLGHPNQMLEADLVYVKDYRNRGMTLEKWKHLALLAHHVMGSFDLAMHCIKRLVEAEGGDIGDLPTDAAKQYRQILREADLVTDN